MIKCYKIYAFFLIPIEASIFICIFFTFNNLCPYGRYYAKQFAFVYLM